MVLVQPDMAATAKETMVRVCDRPNVGIEGSRREESFIRSFSGSGGRECTGPILSVSIRQL